MKQLILIATSLYTFSCTAHKNTSEKVRDSSFGHLPEVFSTFEQVCSKLDTYSKDTLSALEFPGEGGEVIIHYARPENLLIQVLIYGETGKVNYLYLADAQWQHKLTKITQYHYDRPFSMDDMKMDSTVNYISYLPDIKRFDNNKVMINDTTTAQLQAASESLFKEIKDQAALHR